MSGIRLPPLSLSRGTRGSLLTFPPLPLWPDLVLIFSLFFSSRPVVRVRSKLTFTAGKQINLEEKSCTLRDGTRVACLPLSLCMSYDGFGADDVIGEGLALDSEFRP
jgi:hypothetical protein